MHSQQAQAIELPRTATHVMRHRIRQGSGTHFGQRLAGLRLGRWTAGALQGSRSASVAVTTGGSRVLANSSVGCGGSTVSTSHITGVRPNVSCLPCTCPVNLRGSRHRHAVSSGRARMLSGRAVACTASRCYPSTTPCMGWRGTQVCAIAAHRADDDGGSSPCSTSYSQQLSLLSAQFRQVSRMSTARHDVRKLNQGSSQEICRGEARLSQVQLSPVATRRPHTCQRRPAVSPRRNGHPQREGESPSRPPTHHLTIVSAYSKPAHRVDSGTARALRQPEGHDVQGCAVAFPSQR